MKIATPFMKAAAVGVTAVTGTALTIGAVVYVKNGQEQTPSSSMAEAQASNGDAASNVIDNTNKCVQDVRVL